MPLAAIFTLLVLIAALVFMGTQWLRADLTALLVMLALILGGILSPEEAFSAFGQPVIVIVAALYVIGAALYETGVAAMLAHQIMRFSQRGPVVLLLVIMIVAGLLSAIISDLLVVVVLLPAVLRVARRARVAPGQFLIPLVTAAVMGDMLTLIGSISNVAINDVLVGSGYPSLSLFSLTPFGLAFLATAVAWFALVGRRLLPHEVPVVPHRPSLEEVERTYHLEEQLYQLRVRANSDLVGQRLEDARLGTEYRLNVFAIQPAGDDLQPPRNDWILEQDDILIVEGERGDVHQAATLHMLEPKGTFPLQRFERIEDQRLRLAELIVPFRSQLVGKTIADSRFRRRHGLNILAVHRGDGTLLGDLALQKLRAGDTLLVQGPLTSLHRVGRDADLVMVTHLGPEPGELVSSKVGITLLIVGAMIALVVTGLLPLATASLGAALALILSRSVSVERAYHSIDASILVLIGGMLPLAAALQQSGLAQLLADVLAGAHLSPFANLTLIYLVTVLVTQIISNTVTGVLLLPIALNLAAAQGAPIHAFAIAILIGVTTSYLTPLIHGSNLMVRDPGHYQMRDYVVTNGPLLLIQSVVMLGLLAVIYF